MASIEFIQKRIAGKEKEVEKLEKKLERIRKAEASGWEDNPYGYYESDLKWAGKHLEEAKNALEKYRADLAVAMEKAESRNVPAILEFLEMWKTRCFEFYNEGLTAYYAEEKRVRELYQAYENLGWEDPEREKARRAFEEANKAFLDKRRGYFEKWEEERNGRKYRGEQKVRAGEYEYLAPYSYERTHDEAVTRLRKDLTEEANRKYDFIIERTNAIVGKITDASGLEIGAKQDLNGYIVGDKGTAKVQTIGAGGYNVQCFHFRTLINKA